MMSRWLGLGRRQDHLSGNVPNDNDLTLVKHHDSRTFRQTTSQETDCAYLSPSKEALVGVFETGDVTTTPKMARTGVTNSAGMTMDADGSDPRRPAVSSAASEELYDWELVGEDMERHSAPSREISLSPGIDFSRTSHADDDEEEGNVRGAASESTQRKWEDAGMDHGFLVRGPTYFMVRVHNRCAVVNNEEHTQLLPAEAGTVGGFYSDFE